MKLLLDANLSRCTVPRSRVSAWSRRMITRLGCTHGTAISSSPPKDADFYDLSLLHGAAPKVIWLKGGNCNKAAVTRLLVERSDRIASPVGQEQTTCVEIYDDPG